MRTSSKSRQYAEIVLALAAEQNALDSVYRSMLVFFSAYRKQPQLKAALASSKISNEHKRALLAGVFPELNPINQAFLVELADRKDLKLLRQILRAMEIGFYRRSNQVQVEATTTVALSPELEKQIRGAVEAVTHKSADFTANVEPQLLGGMKLRVGNTILDASLASRLQQLRDSLMES